LPENLIMIKKLITLGIFSLSFLSFAQQKFSIIPSVGYAWRTAETASGLTRDEKEYVKGLKHGVNFDIAAYYHPKGSANIAIGVKYSDFSASSSGFMTASDNNGTLYSIPVTTKDKITFFGPSIFISNYNEPSRHKLFVDLALGVITYTTKTTANNTPVNAKGKGNNLGVDAGIGYQYMIHKNFLIGPKLGLTAGTLKKMTVNGVSYEFGEKEREGLHRVSLSAAATFRF